MLDKLKNIKTRYTELSEQLSDSEVIADQAKWQKLVKEHSSLEEIVHKYDQLQAATDSREELLVMRGEETDAEMLSMMQEEIRTLQTDCERYMEELKILLLPRDPNDDKNVILEIRAGTGGDEAALFGADLMRMYTRFGERHGYKIEMMSSNISEIGGVKEAIMSIVGRDVYSRLKFESGVHRVQRVPDTESSGRIHTSAATVAVLPEAEDVEIDIKENELRIDVFRSGGHGGQSVNTTDSAVRITHLPTNMVVTCQDEKSQLKNKEKALRVLKSRLLDFMQAQKDQEYSQNRKSMVGSGDRSERIRTYNFPQGRVTDHRINLTLYKLEAVMDGELDEIIEGLTLADRAARLASQE